MDISERFKTKGKELKMQVLSQSTEFADLAQPRLPKMNQYSDQVYNKYIYGTSLFKMSFQGHF